MTAERNDVVFYVKVTALLSTTPESMKRTRQIVCSRSLEVLQEAMEKKALNVADCPTTEVDDNIRFLQENGIGGVPAIIFADGSINEGFLDARRLSTRIDEAGRRQAK